MRFLLLFIISTAALAGMTPEGSKLKAPAYCEMEPVSEFESIHLLKTVPNYFFKTSGDYIYFTQQGMENMMLNRRTLEMESIGGNSDPVPSADNTILTNLYKDKANQVWEIHVQELKDGVPVGTSQKVMSSGGSYQSVGLPDERGDWPFLYYDDYTHQVKVTHIIEAAGRYYMRERAVFAQTNLRLPMMSPDGTMFTALNTDSNRTELYRIEDGEASLIRELPFSAGKASFSPDGQKLAFHLSRNITGANDEVNYPATMGRLEGTRDVFVYDLETENVTQVTHNQPGADSYFPTFADNETLAFITSEGSSYRFDFADLNSISQINVLDFSCRNQEREEQVIKLASLWAEACANRNFDISSQMDAFYALNLSQENCRELVAEDPELGILCDQIAAAKNQTEDLIQDFQPTISNTCLSCHAGQEDWLRQNKAAAQDAIESGRMPKGMQLTQEQKQDLLEQFQAF